MAARKLLDNQTDRNDPLERIANLLALLAVKGEEDTEKATTLVGAGFTPSEVARLLGKSPNAISVALYKAKKRSHKSR